MNYIRKKSGFTLIEILVVIAIIAILVAFISANFLGARQRAKDVKKKAEFRQMKNALRLYYNDNNVYPGPSSEVRVNSFDGCKNGTPPNDDCLTECSGVFASGATCSSEVYMKLLPPASDYAWSYQQRMSGDDFCLWTTLENTADPEIAKSHIRCNAVCLGVVAATDYVQCADQLFSVVIASPDMTSGRGNLVVMVRDYFVYIATNSTNNTLYTGVTNHLVRRAFEHKMGIGSKFTSKYRVTKLVYYEVFTDIQRAIEREKQIKSGSRKKKIDMIASMNPNWEDLFEKIMLQKERDCHASLAMT